VDHTALIIDQFAFSKGRGHLINTSPTHSEHLTEKFLSDEKPLPPSNPIVNR
jgi:hypothetical protein